MKTKIGSLIFTVASLLIGWPAGAQEVSIRTAKDTYAPGEAIVVEFSGLPGNAKDWINVIAAGSSESSYGDWKYTDGKASGNLSFKGVAAGKYETRVYFNNGTKVRARYAFQVGSASEGSQTTQGGKSGGGGMTKEEFDALARDKHYAVKELMPEGLSSGAGWAHSNFDEAKFLEKARAVDYPNLRETVKTVATKHPSVRTYETKVILEFESKFTEYFEQTLKPVVSEMMEKAFSLKTSNELEAIKYAEEARALSEAAVITLPSYSAAVKLHEETGVTLEKVAGAAFAKIYTSDFHKQNAGRIVFFKSAPTIKTEKATDVSKTFAAGQFIYAMAYLKGSFKTLTKATNDINVMATVYVDGSEKGTYESRMDWAAVKEDKSFLFMEILPDPATNKQAGCEKFAGFLAGVSPTSHDVKIVLSAQPIGGSFFTDVAEGAFSLDASAGTEKIGAYQAAYRSKNLANVVMPAAKLTDAVLSKSMMDALATDASWGTPLRAVITGSEWTIVYDSWTKKILYRTLPAAVALKRKDGTCKYFNLTFKQVYNGSTYGKTEYHAVGSSHDLACENVNK